MLNPIALRKAKIAYNYGLSKCNRVKIWVSGDCGSVLDTDFILLI